LTDDVLVKGSRRFRTPKKNRPGIIAAAVAEACATMAA
jgi:hypothetical protein